MSYVMERLQITDAEREVAWAELRELESKYGKEWLGAYFAGYFGRAVELSAMTGKPAPRSDAVLWLIYDTEYRTEAGTPSYPPSSSPATTDPEPTLSAQSPGQLAG